MDNKLNYVVGAYYFDESMFNRNDVQFPAFLIVSGSIVDNQNYALYGQFTYDFTENWSFTGGYRYSWDRFDSIIDDRIQYITRLFSPNVPGFYIHFPLPPDPAAFTLTPQGVFPSDFNGGDPYLNLAYTKNNWMVYASYSEGYKSGGFSQRLQPGATVVSFGPEEAAVYEAGFKLTALDNSLRLTGSVFHTDYDKLQVSVTSCPQGCVGNAILNAGSAEIDGGELELQVAVTPNLTLSAGVGYLDASYKELEANVSFPATNELPNIPEWTTNASAVLRIPLTGSVGGEVVARLDYTFTDDNYNTASNDFLIESYWLLNANIVYITESEKWELGLQARNLTDEYYWDRGRSMLSTDAAGYYNLGPPRMVAVNFKYRF
jgi:iron complex outermembrane receptor protein